MEPSVALYDFTKQIVDAAAGGSVLSGVIVHLDIYEPYKSNSIRIDDLEIGDDAPGAEIGKISQENQYLRIHFAAMPESNEPADRRAARLRSSAMADGWLLKAFDNLTLPDGSGTARICGGITVPIKRRNSWIRPATIKIPICTLILRLNPR